MERKEKVELLAEALFQGFIKPDGGKHLATTGQISPTSNLRSLSTRKAFELVRRAAEGSDEKRFWTKASLRDAISTMMKEKDLSIPKTSGFSWSEWLKEQVESLHCLSQRARKNAWKMDNLVTLPYDPMGLED